MRVYEIITKAVSTARTHTHACVRVRENPHTGPLTKATSRRRRNERATMCESERERGTSAVGDSPRPSELGTGPTPLTSDPPASLPSLPSPYAPLPSPSTPHSSLPSPPLPPPPPLPLYSYVLVCVWPCTGQYGDVCTSMCVR